MFEAIVELTNSFWPYILEAAQQYWTQFVSWLEAAQMEIAGFNPTQRVVLWIQFVVGVLTIIWIVFQFAWLRRLNEARLERHLEGTISAERDELADERTATLAQLDQVVRARGPWRLVLLLWAHFRLTVSLILKLLTFGTTRGLADHNLLLMKVGAEHRARAIFAEIARDAMKKIKLYKEAIDNKTLEAQNALIFAGRVALVEGRSAAAVLLFRTAKNLREDADAHLLIGKQMAAAGALDSAMREYETVLGFPDAHAQPSTRSEAHRRIAEVHMKRGSRGRARRSLGAAETIDQEQDNFAGLARTQEMIGDLYRPRGDVRNAALSYYAGSAANYERADLLPQARDVRRKLARLQRGDSDLPEGWWTRTLDQCGRWILRQAEKRRVRDHMRAA